MFEKPQKEHEWFNQLEGEWLSETECQMGPDHPPHKSTGEVCCRSMQGMWCLIEGKGEEPDSGGWSTLMTLGYDPKQSQYVGTFVGSMITFLWHYQGGLDESGRKLTLDTEGPKFHGSGTTAYKDSIEIVDDDHWILSSEILTDEGNWEQIMTSHHRRKN